MFRLPTLLLITTLTIGSALAGQELGKEVDARTATDKGAEVDPAPKSAVQPIDAAEIRTEAEADAAFEALAAESEPAWANDGARFLATQDDLSIFLMLLAQADLADSLVQGDRGITLFVPSDTAIAEMDAEEFSTLLEDRTALRDFLQRHIVSGNHSTAALRAQLETGAAMAGEPGAKAVTADAGVEPAGAEGDDGIIDNEPEVTASVVATTSVAGGGPAEDVTPAAIPALDPSSAVRLESRGGNELLVGTRPATVRAQLMRLEDGRPEQVAGGGEAESEDATFYVGNAQIVEPDLAIEGMTVHIIDRVLLPTPEDAAVAR